MAGRPIGSKNTKANELKNMVIHSLDRLGGINYLVQQAKENPSAYLSLIGKVIPRELSIEVEKTAWDAIDEAEHANGNSAKTEI